MRKLIVTSFLKQIFAATQLFPAYCFSIATMAAILSQLSTEDKSRVLDKINSFRTRKIQRTGCLQTLGVPRSGSSSIHTSKKGYPSIRVTRRKVNKADDKLSATLPLHTVAYFLHHGKTSREGEEISHLCHRSDCISIHHLNLESHKVNMERRACRTRSRCIGHEGQPDCIKVRIDAENL